MRYKKPHKHKSPEKDASDLLITYMRVRHWWCKKIHGSIYQSGLPDWYCLHLTHGHRWVETKTKKGYLKESQVITFSEMAKYGEKIYVCETWEDYHKLFKSEDNWRSYIHLLKVT